jgi:NTE family protein
MRRSGAEAGGNAVGDAIDPVLPRSFEARYASGVRRGASLGGGGMFFVAWQLGYLDALARHDIHIDRADRLVGTSAGSIVAATLAHRRLRRMYVQSEILAMAPGLMRVLFPAAAATPSQQAALALYLGSTDSDPETILAIGRAARDADTPDPDRIADELLLVVGDRWRSDALWMTAIDTGTGERCVLTRDTGIPVARGAAASSAVPGIFAPQTLAGRTCMDGGVGGTAVHLDLLAGADRVLVLSLYRDEELTGGLLTLAPGDLTRELDGLRASGTDTFFQAPEHHPMDVDGLMAPAGVPGAMAMGARQADDDVAMRGLAEFWG